MKALILFLVLTADLPNLGSFLLNKVPQYSEDSYFKSKVYGEKDWRAFYKMPEARQVVFPDHYDYHLLNAAFFYALNKLRENNGVKSLSFSTGLRDAAALHTNQMIQKKFFSHENSKGPYRISTPRKRIELFLKTVGGTGENCSLYYIDLEDSLSYLQVAERIVTDLALSPPHRSNMLASYFHYAGCVIQFEPTESNGVRYLKATQDFSSSN